MKLTRRLALLVVAFAASPLSIAADMPRVSVESITAKFGRPDKVTSSANQKPRPPLVTQFVEYKKERVRFVLLADAPIGSAPPYKGWLLMGVQDTETNKKLSSEEVQQRMRHRVKK